MPNVVATNTWSLNAQNSLYQSERTLSTAMERLGSGLRVNSAKDDAAGLAIATGMSSQVRGMNVAIRNANDGISMSQTAESALGSIGDTLQRMRELAVQAANGTYNSGDRANLDTEFQELANEISRVIDNTEFNGIDILAGGASGASGGGIDFQIGANTEADNQINIQIADQHSAGGLTSLGTATVSTAGAATSAMTTIDNALDSITSTRAELGAAQNRLDATIDNLNSSIENQEAAKSRIMDADFAKETARLSQAQVLQQAGTSMLAQANQAPQAVLSLLR